MIIVCPQCASMAQASRESVAWVTCPRAGCGHQFLAWPPGSAVDDEAEFRERRFMCAVYDRPFYVVFARKAKSERFQVVKVHGEQGWLHDALLRWFKGEAPKAVDGTSDKSRALVVQRGGNLAVAAPAPSFRQMLGRVLAPTLTVAEYATARWQRPTAEQMLAILKPKPGDNDDLDFTEVDMEEWFCLHCETEQLDGSYFVECRPRCGELVCLGRSETRARGIYFRCRCSCGCEGQSQIAKILVGGEQFAVPQARGRAGLIGNGRQGVITNAGPPRRLR